MTNEVKEFRNINFLTKEQYEGVTNPATDELWAVETPVIIETYRNGSDWYRVYSDGWCEQGTTTSVSANTTYTWNFLKAFVDLDYQVFVQDVDTLNTTVTCFKLSNKTLTTIDAKSVYTGGAITCQLVACGYAS